MKDSHELKDSALEGVQGGVYTECTPLPGPDLPDNPLTLRPVEKDGPGVIISPNTT